MDARFYLVDRRPLCHTNERVSCYSRVSKKRATKNLQYSVIKHRTGRFSNRHCIYTRYHYNDTNRSPRGSLEFLRTINKVAVNLEGFFFFCSPYHLTIVAWQRFVAVRKWMHYNVIMAKQRIIKFAIFAWFLTIFTWLPLYVMTFAIEDSEARRIWIMIVNFFGIVNVLSSPISSYAMIYNGVRKRRTNNMNNSTALAQAKLQSTIYCQNDWFDNSCSSIHNRLGCFLLNLRLRFPTSRRDFLVEISRTKKDRNHHVRPQALLKKMLWR